MTTSRGTVADFFNLANQKLRQSVPRFSPPSAWSQQHSADFGEIWFPSLGCPWWDNGSCNMCNYGASIKPSPDQMVQAVAISLATFHEIPNILWVSSFDVLDSRDVPVDVKYRIFRLLANTNASTVISESYPGCVTFDGVKKCVEILSGKTFGLEIGVESMDNFVRSWCIHKSFTTDRVSRAISQIKRAGAQSYINLLVAPPFLTPKEAVNDIVFSIQECLDAGADSVVLFPCHIKEHTLCDWLYRRGLYKPPSLWIIIEIIIRSSPENWPRIKLAWLVAKNHPGSSSAICPTIEYENPKEFLNYLIEFDETGDGNALKQLIQSPSYAMWRNSIDFVDRNTPHILERIESALHCIGNELVDGAWWMQHSKKILQQLKNDWNNCQSIKS